MTEKRTYCIDTSGLTAGFYRLYPASRFISLWERVAELVEQGRLIAPEEVYKELQQQDDELYKWVRTRRQMFIASNIEQLALTFEIARDFPALAKRHLAPNPADPWVMALARHKNTCVVHDEKAGSRENPKIPQLCSKYRVEHMRFTDIIELEDWRFP